MQVIVQQIDMDTCLTALLRGVSVRDEISVVRDEARPDDLANPAVLCIEAGGSGQVEENNFDHHNTTIALPPACQQAWQLTPQHDQALARLVEYVATVDVRAGQSIGQRLAPGFPTLSAVFSGMRLTLSDAGAQLLAGLEIFATVLRLGLDPWGLMPALPVWQSYIAAKQQNDALLQHACSAAERFVAASGRQVGYLETTAFGALGVLYGLGCQIAIAYHPCFGTPPIAKYTIGGRDVQVVHLLPWLNALETGWGGPAHGTIIASPRTGSHLTRCVVQEVVRQHG